MQSSQPIEPIGLPGQSQQAMPTYEVAEAEAKQTLYVWQLPVRLTHWVTVISIGILTVTGIYIAHPFLGTSDGATNQFLMGDMRFIHFVAAFAFTISVLFRIYWMFVGNKWASWRCFLPIDAVRRHGIRRMLEFYFFLRRKAPAVIGHNPLAGAAYSVIFLLFLLQIITGFALYALPFHGGFFPTVFGWITVVFGVQPVRLLHDIIMWLILAFMVHHVYTAILIDMEERSGLMSSIFNGYKSFTRHHIEEAETEWTPQPRRKHVHRVRRGRNGRGRAQQGNNSSGGATHV